MPPRDEVARKSVIALTPVQVADVALWMHDTTTIFDCYLNIETGDVQVISHDVHKLDEWDEVQARTLAKAVTGVSYEDLKENHDRWVSIESLLGIRYLAIPRVERWIPYEDMKAFIPAVAPVSMRERLSIAVEGRGAFGKFKGIISRNPALEKQWHDFKAARERDRVYEWLESRGHAVSEIKKK